MAIEEADVRMKDLKITQPAVDPAKIEEPGSKYCCATCYNLYGRVTHIALKDKVWEAPMCTVFVGPLPEKEYRNLGPVVNVHAKVVVKKTHFGGLDELHTYCNHCGDTVGWEWTAKDDRYPKAAYSCDAQMDRTKLVLLKEEEMNPRSLERGEQGIQIGTSGRWESCGLEASRADEAGTWAAREAIKQADE